jgi:hypothetical protein
MDFQFFLNYKISLWCNFFIKKTLFWTDFIFEKKCKWLPYTIMPY